MDRTSPAGGCKDKGICATAASGHIIPNNCSAHLCKVGRPTRSGFGHDCQDQGIDIFP
jgi:hypothetical protein